MSQASATYRILLVEDDAELALMVADFLRPHGFEVLIEGRGDTAVDRIVEENPDMVLLDVNLPGLDGFSVCQNVRVRYSGAIIMLTARGEEIDEVVGFEVGADDYMAKPIRPRALLARMRTHLRRVAAPNEEAAQPSVQVGSLIVVPSRRTVMLEEEAVDLTTAEFDLLYLLATNVGKSLSRDQIYQEIHGIKYDGLDRSIDLRISRLRKKIGDDPARPTRIKSVRGVGYILAAET